MMGAARAHLGSLGLIVTDDTATGASTASTNHPRREVEVTVIVKFVGGKRGKE